MNFVLKNEAQLIPQGADYYSQCGLAFYGNVQIFAYSQSSFMQMGALVTSTGWMQFAFVQKTTSLRVSSSTTTALTGDLYKVSVECPKKEVMIGSQSSLVIPDDHKVTYACAGF